MRVILSLAIVVIALAVTGCGQSPEEDAIDAYEEGRYGEAWALAETMAQAGNPRGFELQALMAVQGLGVERNFTRAMALIDQAIAIDPAFETTRPVIEERIAAAEKNALRAFETGDYVRAQGLSLLLANYGNEAGAELLETLVIDQYVPQDGSEIAWRRFWDRCSGNTRYENAKDSPFDAECLGRQIVWDGMITTAKGRSLYIRMNPGRTRAKQDLIVELAEDPERDTVRRGHKVRFSATISGRGDSGKPDRLNNGTILGPAPLSRDEMAAITARAQQTAWTRCRRLLDEYFQSAYEPAWYDWMMGQSRPANLPEPFVHYIVSLDQAPQIFRLQNSGGWRGDVTGIILIEAEVWDETVYGGRPITELRFDATCLMEQFDTGARMPTIRGRAEVNAYDILSQFDHKTALQ